MIDGGGALFNDLPFNLLCISVHPSVNHFTEINKGNSEFEETKGRR